MYLAILIEGTPPGGVFYLLCSLIKSRVYEISRRDPNLERRNWGLFLFLFNTLAPFWVLFLFNTLAPFGGVSFLTPSPPI